MKARPSKEDIELFRETVGKVKPVRHDSPVAAPRKRPARARLARANRLAALGENPHADIADPPIPGAEVLSYRQSGVQESVLRKLRRGEYRVEGEIDLHGLTAAQGGRALRAFLSAALARHAGCVRIIHGKGLRSGNEGSVLKGAVSGILRRTPAVEAYVSARPADGGTGAVYVLLSQIP